jgi:hypothetical protein
MQTSTNYIDEIFDFNGLWGIPSKCGLRRILKNDRAVVIVTELYQENTGSSVTSVAALLAKQIADKYHYDPAKLIYIECNPNMKSKLSFYDEEYFLVSFDYVNEEFMNPSWAKLSKEEFTNILKMK